MLITPARSLKRPPNAANKIGAAPPMVAAKVSVTVSSGAWAITRATLNTSKTRNEMAKARERRSAHRRPNGSVGGTLSNWAL
jgi:hypothetical protein